MTRTLVFRRHRARFQTVPDQRHRTPRCTRPGRGRTAKWTTSLWGSRTSYPLVSASTCPINRRRRKPTVKVLVELQRHAPSVAVEDDRRDGTTVEARRHAEVKRHLVALAGRDRAAVVAALDLGDDDGARSSHPEDGVGSAGEAVDDHRPRGAVSAEVARDDADGCGIEAPVPRQSGRVPPAVHGEEGGRAAGDENRRGGGEHQGRQVRYHATTIAMRSPMDASSSQPHTRDPLRRGVARASCKRTPVGHPRHSCDGKQRNTQDWRQTSRGC